MKASGRTLRHAVADFGDVQRAAQAGGVTG